MQIACNKNGSGYTSKVIHFKCIQKWYKFVSDGLEIKPSQRYPVILITDGHKSRHSSEMLKWCRKNHIIIFEGVPNGTAEWGPLDAEPFKVFQTYRSFFKLKHFQKYESLSLRKLALIIQFINPFCFFFFVFFFF